MRFVIDGYERLVLGRPVLTLSLLAVLLMLFGAFIPRFELDVSADSLVLENDADLEYYRNIRARYGSDDYLILTYSPIEAMFSEENLQRIGELRDRLRGIDGVESVTTMLDVPLLESPPISLDEFREGAPKLEQPSTDRAMARRELTESPLYRNRLIGPDGETCAIQIVLQQDETHQSLLKERDGLRVKKLGSELTAAERERLSLVEEQFYRYSKQKMEQEAEVIRAVRSAMNDYRKFAQLHLGGVPMVVSDMMSFIRHDLVTFGFAVLAILALMLLFVFRKLQWVILPLLTAAATAVITTGFLGMVGWPVTVVSSNFLALVLIFSLSLTIHLIVRYRELHHLQPHADQRALVSQTLRSKAAPCFFNALTTMVAFCSLVVSDIRPVIDFGWIMVFALAASLALAFTLYPASLMLIQPGEPYHGSDIMGKITEAFASLVEKHGGKLLLLSATLVLFGSIGMSRLTVENRFIDYFHSSSEIFQGMKLIDEKLGGTTPMDVIIQAPVRDESIEDEWDEDDPFADENGEPGFANTSYWFNTRRMEQIAAIHDYLDALPETGKVLSLHTAMTLLQKLEDKDAIDNMFLSVLYKKLPPDIKAQLVSPYISEDGQQLRFAVRIYESNIGLNRNELLEKIADHLNAEKKDQGEQVHLSGMVVLYNNLLQSLFSSQIQTLGMVFVAILITFALVFRSLKVAAIAIIPNIIPAVLVLGLLGGLGIPLDIMTITIAAIAVGIAVDDTIHYVHRYHEEVLKDGDYRAAVHRAHNSIGRAMYYTSITITIGFISMALSNFVPTIYFGLFTAFAMISALLTNITVLPVLLRTLKPYGKLEQMDQVQQSRPDTGEIL
jgi:predicted RND superfamily exporter protein